MWAWLQPTSCHGETTADAPTHPSWHQPPTLTLTPALTPSGQCCQMWWTISNCRTPKLSATKPSSTLSMSSSPSSPLGSLWAFPPSVCSKYQRHHARNSNIFTNYTKQICNMDHSSIFPHKNTRFTSYQLQCLSPLNILVPDFFFFYCSSWNLKTSVLVCTQGNIKE